MALGKHIAEMLFLAGTTAGDDGYRQGIGQFTQSFVGITVLRAVVVHRRKQYLASATFLSLTSPLKQASLRTFTSAL